jgi:hypothetical protein
MPRYRMSRGVSSSCERLTVKEPVEIQYRDFYDVPRLFIVEYGGTQYLFDCSFDDLLDEYPDAYQVFVLPRLSAADLAGPWTNLRQRAVRHVGTLAISEAHFDPTRRRAIEADDVRRFAQGHQSSLNRTGTD